MKKLSLLVLIFMVAILVGCSNKNENEIEEPYGFLNSDFESGDLDGWKIEGNAFKHSNVSFQSRNNQGIDFNKKDNYFYNGNYSNDGHLTGSMISSEFVLKGNGIIGFMMGAGKNKELTYVSFLNNKDKELLRVSNYYFNGTEQMFRLTADLSEYLGEKIKIKVVDLDSSDDEFNYLNIDDFIINFNGPYEASGEVTRANNFIKDNMHKLKNRYRHTYHAMSSLNWANDPNGVIWYNDEFHLFYQNNPYNPSWGPMHWGHQTTKDFIKWEHKDVALAPDMDYDLDLGAFSGTAIEVDGNLVLMYTSVSNGLQQQAIARSFDGGNVFVKDKNNPVIDIFDLPTNADTGEFRDPKVWYENGMYYIMVGGKTNGFGNILLYKSKDLENFIYVGEMLNNKNKNKPGFYQLTGGIYEVPDYFLLDGKEILISSPMRVPESNGMFQNLHSVVYMEGKLNYDTGEFVQDGFVEIDDGFDFYAAQTAKLPDGRQIMIAWMQMWDRTMPTQVDGWAGAFTLPRELSYKDGRLYQIPVREITNYRKNEIIVNDITINDKVASTIKNVSGNKIELEIELDLTNSNKVHLELLKGSENSTLITYDKSNELLTFDRSNSGRVIKGIEQNLNTRVSKVPLINNKIKLRIFIDVSSIEIFINDGYKTMTSNVYPTSEDLGISFLSEGGNTIITSLKKYDIVVD